MADPKLTRIETCITSNEANFLSELQGVFRQFPKAATPTRTGFAILAPTLPRYPLKRTGDLQRQAGLYSIVTAVNESFLG